MNLFYQIFPLKQFLDVGFTSEKLKDICFIVERVKEQMTPQKLINAGFIPKYLNRIIIFL